MEVTGEILFIPQLSFNVVLTDVHENLVHLRDIDGGDEPMPQRKDASGRKDSVTRPTALLRLDDTVAPLQQSPEFGMKRKAEVVLQLGDLSSLCRRPKGSVIRG
ncbi:hypothetical protein GCM10018783_19110 [Streptomyces griseosporeus]|nr:hypothetical protein GCM10018783_19110 [Streptomyces griseosporeus]